MSSLVGPDFQTAENDVIDRPQLSPGLFPLLPCAARGARPCTSFSSTYLPTRSSSLVRCHPLGLHLLLLHHISPSGFVIWLSPRFCPIARPWDWSEIGDQSPLGAPIASHSQRRQTFVRHTNDSTHALRFAFTISTSICCRRKARAETGQSSSKGMTSAHCRQNGYLALQSTTTPDEQCQ